jgi:cytochrome b
MRLSMRVWDAPVRLFHWALVLLIALSYVSNDQNWMQVHFLSGYTILTLLLFRLVWGFIGSDTARFSRFLKSPLAGFQHLAHFARREPDLQIGHNAAGGWMVVVLLLDVLVQVVLGLFSNDDVISEGPLAKYVGKRTSDTLSHLHAVNFNILLGLMGLHVLVVLAYAVVKRQDLIRPMITGRKRLPPTMRAPRMVHPLLALVVLLVAAGLVWAFVSLI